MAREAKHEAAARLMAWELRVKNQGKLTIEMLRSALKERDMSLSTDVIRRVVADVKLSRLELDIQASKRPKWPDTVIAAMDSIMAWARTTALAELSADREDLLAERERINQVLAETESRNQALEKAVAATQQELALLQGQLEAEHVLRHAAENERDRAIAEAQRTALLSEERMREADVRVRDAEQRIQVALDNAQEHIKKLETDLEDRSRHWAETTDAQRQESQARIREMREQLESLTQSTERRVRDFESRLASAVRERNSFEKEAAALSSQVEVLTESVLRHERQYTEISTKLSSTSAELMRWKMRARRAEQQGTIGKT